MTTIPEVLQEAREQMDNSIDSVRRELGGVRSGKATTQLLDLVRVEAYGQVMPLNQVALVNAPEPRMLTVQPFDKSQSQAIEKAIRDADLGLNPSSQGAIIRVPVPALSEERRKELVRLTHKLAEEGRVAVRHARHDALTKIKKLEKVPEDEVSRAEKEVQKHTDEHIKLIDELLRHKEAEIMEV
jgi:ribosome recycling factor